MVTTVMRETTLFVDVVTPKATEIKKMEKKSLVSYIYIGSPIKRLQGSYGTSARIQLNDAFADVEEIQEFIATEREGRDQTMLSKTLTSPTSVEFLCLSFRS